MINTSHRGLVVCENCRGRMLSVAVRTSYQKNNPHGYTLTAVTRNVTHLIFLQAFFQHLGLQPSSGLVEDKTKLDNLLNLNLSIADLDLMDGWVSISCQFSPLYGVLHILVCTHTF